jgi:mannose-6-phosphate isomerase-like protein (cupin superfamily)
MEAIALGPDDGERVPRGERFHRILCALDAFEAVDMRFAPGFEGVTPHVHPDHVDAFYVLAGEAEFTLAGRSFRAPAGSFVAAPPGVEHGFRNAGEVELRMLNVTAPNAGFTEWIRGH